MYGKVKEHLAAALENLKQAGLYKEERIIESPQQAAIQVMVRKCSTSALTTILVCLTTRASSRGRRR